MLQQNFIGLIMLFAVILERGKLRLIQYLKLTCMLLNLVKSIKVNEYTSKFSKGNNFCDFLQFILVTKENFSKCDL